MVVPDHFKVNPAKARALFAKSVSNIEIEISSYCNRVCSYCPNSFIDRRSANDKISDSLYSSIINQLAEIDWQGTLAFHRYNEPLKDRSYLISRIREARLRLPHAELTVFTNGDYLTEDYLHELYMAGCRKIYATIHIDPEDYDDATATNLLKKRLSKFQYDYRLQPNKRGISAEVYVACDLKFIYQIIDFGRSADGKPVRMDRGQALTPNNIVLRNAPCNIPFTEMQIELDGTLVPCRNIRTDVPEHRDYILGKLNPDSDLFMAWTNAEYVKWRKSLSGIGPKAAPCSTCNYGMFDESYSRRLIIREFLLHPIRSIPQIKALLNKNGIVATLSTLKEFIRK